MPKSSETCQLKQPQTLSLRRVLPAVGGLAWKLGFVCCLGALAGSGACASAGNRKGAESHGAMPPRQRDSVAEKAAAARAASGNLQLEAESARWGIDAAEERKRRADAARTASGEPEHVPLPPPPPSVAPPASPPSPSAPVPPPGVHQP